jgi:hypothetical protein
MVKVHRLAVHDIMQVTENKDVSQVIRKQQVNTPRSKILHGLKYSIAKLY